MVATRVHNPCPPSARTTTEISELTGMISGLVQRQALLTALLTGLLRQTGSERPAKATATAARKPALLTGLLSKSAVPVKHISAAASLITAPLLSKSVVPLLSKSAVPVTHLSSDAPRPVSRSKVKAKVQAYRAKVKATQQASLNSTLNACLLIDTIMHNCGLDPTHTTVCAGNLVQPLSKVVTSCADSAATSDFLAGPHCREATNQVELSHPLQIATAGHDTTVTHRGDLTLDNGLPMQGAFLLPDSSITLTSIPKRIKLGWSFIAKGLYALFISPAAKTFHYILHEGLYVPASALPLRLLPLMWHTLKHSLRPLRFLPPMWHAQLNHQSPSHALARIVLPIVSHLASL